MEVAVIKESSYAARKQHKMYLQALKTHRQPYMRALATAAFHLKQGRGIIDVYAACKQAGVNANQEPRIAIARADAINVTFRKYENGRGSFWSDGKDDTRHRVALPSRTFPDWEMRAATWGGREISRSRIETKVPIVPAHLLPRSPLSRYFILWEAEDWEEVTRDPVLLQRINNNLFAVFATWDLTPLERALINGRA